MADSGLRTVRVDIESRFLRVSDDFLVGIDGLRLVRYLGNEPDCVISSEIEAITSGCFCGCASITSVVFEPGCRLSALAELSFSSCSLIESICIP
jgi:hypothetical protein